MNAAIETIKTQIRTQDTDTILSCIMQIGGGQVDTKERMVRACLIDIYEEREGQDATDTLLDILEM